jgi:hypothetical protein
VICESSERGASIWCPAQDQGEQELSYYFCSDALHRNLSSDPSVGTYLDLFNVTTLGHGNYQAHFAESITEA